MPALPSKNSSPGVSPVATVSRGLTLMEMTVAMMIVAILSVGISSLVKTGVESHLARATDENMQVVSMNIVDDLRIDLRTADNAIISNGGNTLTIVPSGGDGTDNIVYTLSGTDLTRTRNGGRKVYNDTVSVRPRLAIACPGGACFTGWEPDPVNKGVMLADNVSPQQVVLPNLTVRSAGQNTIIDNAFGAPNFAVRNVTLNLTSQTTFQ